MKRACLLIGLLVSCAAPAPMHQARTAPLVTGPDGKLYAIGGTAPSGATLSSVEAYDPKTNGWLEMSPLLHAVEGNSAILGPDGRIYSLGGDDGIHLTSEVEVFNVTANSWSEGPPLPMPLSAPAAVGRDGRLYVVGGTVDSDGGEVESSAVEVFDFNSRTWSTGPALPVALLPVATVGPDGKLYVLGGLEGQQFQRSSYVLDATKQAWITIDPVPSEMAGGYGAVSATNGKIFLIGGLVAGQPCNIVDEPADPCIALQGPLSIFDTDGGVWETGPMMPRPRGAPGLALGSDGRIYVAGGVANVEFEGQYSLQATPDLQILSPDTLSWWD